MDARYRLKKLASLISAATDPGASGVMHYDRVHVHEEEPLVDDVHCSFDELGVLLTIHSERSHCDMCRTEGWKGDFDLATVSSERAAFVWAGRRVVNE